MPSLNFQARFADRVAEGSKRRTIRAGRKRLFKSGDNLAFFTGMRTKMCRRLRPNAPCRSASRIEIDTVRETVRVADRVLTADEISRARTGRWFRKQRRVLGLFPEDPR